MNGNFRVYVLCVARVRGRVMSQILVRAYIVAEDSREGLIMTPLTRGNNILYVLLKITLVLPRCKSDRL